MLLCLNLPFFICRQRLLIFFHIFTFLYFHIFISSYFPIIYLFIFLFFFFIFNFLQDATGPLSETAHKIDRTQLPSYQNRIRRFHPDELLAISGFPKKFIWPKKSKKLNLEKCCGCVGNSINVAVVRCVMLVLFGVDNDNNCNAIVEM